MKRIGLTPLVIIALFAGACGRPEAPAPPPATSPEDAAPAVAEAPDVNVLMAREKEATAAWLKGDAAFFEGMLNDPFVMLAPDGSRMDRAASIGLIRELKCTAADGWMLDEPRVSRVDADTYVLTYRGTFDGTCTLDGRSEKIPSPVRAATVWVRRDAQWRAAYHGENPILAPGAAAPSKAKPPAAEAGKTAPDTSTATAPANSDAAAMAAVETAVWDAWKNRDRQAMAGLTAADLAFVDIFGNVTSGKEETLTFWSSHQCEVKSTRVTEGAATQLSPTVAILSFKGILDGTCGGEKFPLIHGTSVYVKDGDDWKLAFTLNHLVVQ